MRVSWRLRSLCGLVLLISLWMGLVVWRPVDLAILLVTVCLAISLLQALVIIFGVGCWLGSLWVGR